MARGKPLLPAEALHAQVLGMVRSARGRQRRCFVAKPLGFALHVGILPARSELPLAAKRRFEPRGAPRAARPAGRDAARVVMMGRTLAPPTPAIVVVVAIDAHGADGQHAELARREGGLASRRRRRRRRLAPRRRHQRAGPASVAFVVGHLGGGLQPSGRDLGAVAPAVDLRAERQRQVAPAAVPPRPHLVADERRRLRRRGSTTGRNAGNNEARAGPFRLRSGRWHVRAGCRTPAPGRTPTSASFGPTAQDGARCRTTIHTTPENHGSCNRLPLHRRNGVNHVFTAHDVVNIE